MTFIFPAHILTPGAIQRSITGVALDGGEALSGETDVIETDGGGRWRVVYEGVEVTTPKAARIWDAWLDYLGGGTQTCLVPLLSLPTSPRAMTGRENRRVSPVVVDDDEWPTEMAYSVPEHSAEFTFAAALRATTVYLDATKGPTPHAGALFSVPDGRAYRVLRNVGGGAFTIRPPLRAAINAATAAVFDFPLMLCSLEPGQDFASPLARGMNGTVSVAFREARP